MPTRDRWLLFDFPLWTRAFDFSFDHKYQCHHNLWAIVVILTIAILIIVVKIDIVTTCVYSTLDCGQTAAMGMHTCSIRKRLFAEMQNHNCLRCTLRLACVFLQLRKKFWTAGERSSFFTRINFLKTCIMTNGWCDQQEGLSSGLSSQVLEIFLKSLWGIFLILVLKGTWCRIAFSSVE